VRPAGPLVAVRRDQVPLLAGDLARLAADADRGVGEEAHPRLLLRLRVAEPGAVGELGHVLRTSAGSVAGSCSASARLRTSSTSSGSAAPRGRRPGRIPHVKALTSWMWTFGSSTIVARSLAESPATKPRVPQWYGRPT